MLGTLYYKLFDSKIGEKYLDTEVYDGGMKWTEKGMRRFFFWNCMLWFMGLFGLFTIIGSFQLRYVFSIIILSLYLVEKSSETLVAVFEDVDKIDFERDDSDIKETNRYKYLKRALNGEKILDES